MSKGSESLVKASRRQLLKSALLGGAAVTGSLPLMVNGETKTPAALPVNSGPEAPPKGYVFLTPSEASFVEALADHMVPADALSPSGVALGIPVYIDRALAGSWGKGDRLYLQGPWQKGLATQGYQLPLTPSQLYRAGIAATNSYCRKSFGKTFDALDALQKEAVLKDLSADKISFEEDLSPKVFFAAVYQTIVEGLFADPIYGGNADKAGWKMVGFPGVIATNAQNIIKFKNKKYIGPTLDIADAS